MGHGVVLLAHSLQERSAQNRTRAVVLMICVQDLSVWWQAVGT